MLACDSWEVTSPVNAVSMARFFLPYMLACDSWEVTAHSGLAILFVGSHMYLSFAWQMQEVFDPPETERKAETKIGTTIRKDVIFEQDSCSSYQLCMCPGSFQRNQILLARFCWVCVYLPPNFAFIL